MDDVAPDIDLSDPARISDSIDAPMELPVGTNAGASANCGLLGWTGADAIAQSIQTTRVAGQRGTDWVLIWDGPISASPARQGLAVNAQGEIFVGHNGFRADSPRLTAFVRKLDAEGEPLWSRSWSTGRGSFGEEVFAVVALPDGGVAVGGQYQRAEPACEGARSALGCTDAFITRFDRTGAEEWSLVFGNFADFDRVMGLALAGDGTLYASGQVSGRVSFASGVVLQSQGGVDHFVLALAPNRCSVRWARAFGSSGQDLDGPAVVALADGAAVGPVHASDGSLRRFARDGTELFAIGPAPATRGVLASGPDDRLWVSGTSPVTSGANTFTELVQLAANGDVLGRYERLSPAGGVYGFAGLITTREGRTLLAATYGMQPLYIETREIVNELLELDAGGLRVLSRYPLWAWLGGVALAGDGALLEAGAFEKASDFGLGAGQIQANGRDWFLLHRAL
jgi:hypothetical protein